jgi:GNAT superfamily N-acetyltransferase
MTDVRIAAVEDNLVSLFAAAAQQPALTRAPDADVEVAYYTDRAFPLLNLIAGAHFADGDVERRARELVADYTARGLPFLWWTTPSGHADELGPVLTELGLFEEQTPGMHRALDGPVDPGTPADTEIVRVDSSGTAEWMDVLLPSFGIPDDFRPDVGALLDGVDPARLIQVVARRDGEPVGCGSGWLTGDTIGLYNIGTLEAVRGRGIGYAVTATLMNLAHELGARQAILHASESGRPVYERLGFEEVCRVPQFVWVPEAT